jgi:phage protein
MNKQDLIKRIEVLPYTEGPIADTITINRNWILESIKQLDEPETGHADEAPRYVKNILARLRELPLHNREVWLKAIMGEFEQDFSHAKWREGYEQGKLEGAWVGNQLKDADKIRRELNKVKIPQFVADWIEEARKSCKDVADLFDFDFTNEEVGKWFMQERPFDLVARAWLDGYTNKEEKRYLVKVKGVCGNHETLNCEKHSKKWLFSDREENSLYKTKHTRKELEDAGFGEVFNSSLFEVVEVE